MARSRRPVSQPLEPGGWRLLRWRLAVLLPAAGSRGPAEARPCGFDELVLLQRDLSSLDPSSQQDLHSLDPSVRQVHAHVGEAVGRRPNEQREEIHHHSHHSGGAHAGRRRKKARAALVEDEARGRARGAPAERKTVEEDDFRDLDATEVFPQFTLLRQTIATFPKGINGSLFKVLKDSFTGGGSLVSKGNRYMTGAEQFLYKARKVFARADEGDGHLARVSEACVSITSTLNQHRQRLAESLAEFSQLFATVRHEDVIPLTANIVSKEVLTLQPVAKASIKDIMRVLRHVDWGDNHNKLNLHLFNIEPVIVHAAGIFATSLSDIIRDYDDLTSIGFCRTAAPVVLGIAASSRTLQELMQNVSGQTEEILALQTTRVDPAWEEEPELLEAAKSCAVAGSTLVGLFWEEAQWLNATVGRAMRQRLHCPEISAAASRSWLLALAAAAVSAWAPSVVGRGWPNF